MRGMAIDLSLIMVRVDRNSDHNENSYKGSMLNLAHMQLYREILFSS